MCDVLITKHFHANFKLIKLKPNIRHSINYIVIYLEQSQQRSGNINCIWNKFRRNQTRLHASETSLGGIRRHSKYSFIWNIYRQEKTPIHVPETNTVESAGNKIWKMFRRNKPTFHVLKHALDESNNTGEADCQPKRDI